jgi:hypothetical protein
MPVEALRRVRELGEENRRLNWPDADQTLLGPRVRVNKQNTSHKERLRTIETS